MEFRLLDEAIEIEGKGLMLFAMAEDLSIGMSDGCRIRDSRGNVHTVKRVGTQEALVTLYIEGGDLNYFERLFRDIRIDATLFTLLTEEAN
ncbi:MAG TPA: hypothetical protein PKU80_06630 [Candidatus Limiplasma sp.]|nr:hypothetical protein [Candidatus Limiplasma sp.]HRX08846.1 hypothetical protein [Candidatus Limiplasma sp.]